MPNDPLVVAVVAAVLAAAAVALLARGRRWASPCALALFGGAAGTFVAARLAREPAIAEADVAARPIQVANEGYVSSSTCRACHAREYATWQQSFHRTMTQRVDRGSNVVRGDFDDVHLTFDGKDYLLTRADGDCWVELDNPVPVPGAPPRVKARVCMTTGSHHMQLCWYETGYSRSIGLLPFAWQVGERRWIPRRSAFVLPPTDPVDASVGVWSLVCLKCHATHALPRIETNGGQMSGADTTVGEFGIACEACHGPGEAHVALNQNPLRRYASHFAATGDASVVNPARLPHDRATMVCAQCHAQWDYLFDEQRTFEWFRDGFRYRPGQDLMQQRAAKTDGEGQFWSDGLVRIAGREFNAMMGSLCYTRGELACTSCHRMHQATTDARPPEQWAAGLMQEGPTDRACTQCHQQLAANVAAHSHHAADSIGSSCVNCHMPHTTYGLLKGVRTHRIDNPSVAVATRTGRPNACNQCHLDRSLAWTAQRLAEWYGNGAAKTTGDDENIAAGVLQALRGDAAQRALVAWNLGWPEARQTCGTDWIAPYLAELIDDPYDSVRIIAERSLRTLPGFADVPGTATADAAARHATKAAVLARWQQTDHRPAGDRVDRAAAVLIGSDGGLVGTTYSRLLQKRDLRAVRLFE